MCEPYNGWANRETWCVSLYLSNDEAWYATARTLAREAETLFGAADALRDLWEQWAEDVIEGTASRDVRMCIADVGSAYRVDWMAVAEHFRED